MFSYMTKVTSSLQWVSGLNYVEMGSCVKYYFLTCCYLFSQMKTKLLLNYLLNNFLSVDLFTKNPLFVLCFQLLVL